MEHQENDLVAAESIRKERQNETRLEKEHMYDILDKIRSRMEEADLACLHSLSDIADTMARCLSGLVEEGKDDWDTNAAVSGFIHGMSEVNGSHCNTEGGPQPKVKYHKIGFTTLQ